MGALLTSRELLCAAAAEHGDRDAIVFEGRRTSFTGLLDAAARLARGFAERGVGHGDRVGLWLPNWPEWIFARYALGILGAVCRSRR